MPITNCKLPQTKWPNNISISSQFSYELDSIELHSCCRIENKVFWIIHFPRKKMQESFKWCVNVIWMEFYTHLWFCQTSPSSTPVQQHHSTAEWKKSEINKPHTQIYFGRRFCPLQLWTIAKTKQPELQAKEIFIV